MNHWIYFLILGGAVLLPVLFSGYEAIGFRYRIKNCCAAITLVAAPFVLWDILFTHSGVWSFNDQLHLGIVILGLPLEEVLFFFFIPYCCLFTYHCLGKSIPPSPIYSAISVILAFLCAALFFVYWGRLYSCGAAILAAVVFVYAAWKKPKYLGQFFYSYVVLLVPFLVVNGALTGTFTNEAIVIYNPEQIMGLRILTIPVEDFIYCAVLIFANVAVFEWLEGRRERVSLRAPSS